MERYKGNRGFSLVELLIVVSIVGALVGFGLPNYLKYRSQAVINADASQMVEFFREGLARANSQQSGSTWAFYIVDDTDDYYGLVQDGATTTPISVTYLSPGVEFSATSTTGVIDMTEGPTLTPLASDINIGLRGDNGSLTDEITVEASGKITRTKNY